MLLSKRGKPLFAFSFSFVFDKKSFYRDFITHNPFVFSTLQITEKIYTTFLPYDSSSISMG